MERERRRGQKYRTKRERAIEWEREIRGVASKRQSKREGVEDK